MRINEMRKSIVLTSSKEFIEEISDYFFNGSFSNKGIIDVRDIFAFTHNNQSKRNDEDFKYFYDKVAYVDYCKFNNLAHNGLAAKKYLAAAFNPQTREFSYSSNKFYKEGNNTLNTMLILNVKGKDIYKVLTAIYTCLRDNGIDNCITIPSYNRFEEGLTDSIRININVADMERVVNLIGDLPLPIVNLIDKPNMLYPKVNEYIGYDALIGIMDHEPVRASFLVCQSISNALYYTIMDFLERDPNETIANGAESIIEYRKKCLNNDQPLVECDLRILQRMISIDPSNKRLFTKNLEDALLGSTMTKSAYIDKESNDLFDEAYGKLDDETILFNGSLEIPISSPSVEFEDDLTINKETGLVQNNELSIQEEPQTDLMVQEEPQTDLMVQQEQVRDLMVQEDNPKDLMVQEEQAKDLLVTESADETKKEESLYQSFMNRTGSSEEYLDSLLASAGAETQGNISEVKEDPQVESAPVEREKTFEDGGVHFYESAASLGDNFVISSTTAETTKGDDISSEFQQEIEASELVRPEDMTEEQKKLVSDTYAELPNDDTSFFDYLEQVLNKLPDDNMSDGENETTSEQLEEELNPQEIQSLSSNSLDQQMTYERALKYRDLVSSISVLNTKVRGTDFTLLDYFDQQQLLAKIKPNARYMIFTDEIYTGLEVVENCIIKFVSNYGNVPLDKIMEEYGIQELVQEEKKERPKGLKGLFKRKRS